MKTRVLFAVLFLAFFSITGISQEKFYTKTGKITFFSSAPMENIEAVNRSVTTILNTKTGDLQFSVLMKGFEFKKALMQEHFNDKYVESDKFPKATFTGVIANNSAINYTVNGSYPATVKGKLTIHGVTKDVISNGTIVVKDGKITTSAVFMVAVADYNITIPKLYRDNIAKSVKVTVDCNLSPL